MSRALRALLVLVALVLVTQLLNLVSHPSGTTLGLLGAANPQVRPVVHLFERKCAHCHTTDARRPVYAWLPGVRQHLDHDVRRALGEFDLVAKLVRRDGGPVSEPALAKIEYVVERHSMPPGDYRAMHWDAHLDDSNRMEILPWVHDLRRHYYAPEGLPQSVQEGAVHPLPGADPRLNPSAVALGEKLYNDARVSADNTVSCATCHDLEQGGCNHESLSKGIRGQRGSVNTPTTFNVVFHRNQGWNGRAASLEEQMGCLLEDPVAAGSEWPAICAKLAQDAAFASEFRAVYPDGFSKASVTSALAAFERTLVTPHSRFDRYLLGETAALTGEEQRGYGLFQQYGCQTCHVGKALGGQSFERLGRRADFFGDRGRAMASDVGRAAVTGDPADRYVFKVPSLRNVARTYPYLHDGSVPDLRQAVHIMLRYQVGCSVPEPDVECIAKFLESLTGEYRGKPL
jgi:cytochrome c peroxidase